MTLQRLQHQPSGHLQSKHSSTLGEEEQGAAAHQRKAPGRGAGGARIHGGEPDLGVPAGGQVPPPDPPVLAHTHQVAPVPTEGQAQHAALVRAPGLARVLPRTPALDVVIVEAPQPGLGLPDVPQQQPPAAPAVVSQALARGQEVRGGGVPRQTRDLVRQVGAGGRSKSPEHHGPSGGGWWNLL